MYLKKSKNLKESKMNSNLENLIEQQRCESPRSYTLTEDELTSLEFIDSIFDIMDGRYLSSMSCSRAKHHFITEAINLSRPYISKVFEMKNLKRNFILNSERKVNSLISVYFGSKSVWCDSEFVKTVKDLMLANIQLSKISKEYERCKILLDFLYNEKEIIKREKEHIYSFIPLERRYELGKHLIEKRAFFELKHKEQKQKNKKERKMNVKPIIEEINGRKMWLMPDGEYIPYIAGGSGADDDPADSGNPDNNAGSGNNNELESKLKDARDDAAKYRTKLRELESKLDGIDLEEYKTLKEKAAEAEEKAALARGDYEKLLSEKTASLKGSIDSQKKEAEKWKSLYESKIVNEQVAKVAEANNAVNSDDVLTIVKAQYNIAVDDEGSVKVMKGDVVATDGQGNPLTIDGVVKSVLEERAYLVKSADSGAGAEGGTGKGVKIEMTSREKIAAGLKKRGLA